VVGDYAGSDDYLRKSLFPGYKNRQKLGRTQHSPLHPGHKLLLGSDLRLCATYIGVCCRTLHRVRSDGALFRLLHFRRMASRHGHSPESGIGSLDRLDRMGIALSARSVSASMLVGLPSKSSDTEKFGASCHDFSVSFFTVTMESS
jgi:hypothetical protein